MIRAGAVITQRFRGKMPEEDRAGVPDAFEIVVRVPHREFQVFRRQAVDDIACLLSVFDQDHGAVVFHCRANNAGAFHPGDQPVDGCLDPCRQVCVGSYQHGPGVLVVLSLREHVHGYPVRIRAVVRDDHHLGGACDHVNADDAEHQAFGGRHVAVSGPHDLVDGGDRTGAEGQRGHGLRAADGERPVHSRYVRGRQHHGVHLLVRGRRSHDDFPDSRHPRRYGVHEDG